MGAPKWGLTDLGGQARAGPGSCLSGTWLSPTPQALVGLLDGGGVGERRASRNLSLNKNQIKNFSLMGQMLLLRETSRN